MKIAFHVPFWPIGSAANGIVTYASQLVPALRRLGHEVFVLAGYIESGHEDPYTIDLRRFVPAQTLFCRVMFRVAPEVANFKRISDAIVAAVRELKTRRGLDVIEIEDSFGWSYSISKLKILPVVTKIHGPWFQTEKFEISEKWIALNRHRERWEARALQHAQLVTAPSAAVLQAVKDHTGFHNIASRVIPNPLRPADAAETWNIKTCNQSLLFVGRFDALKGGDLVLRAFAELAQLYPELRLTFVGPDRGLKDADGIVHDFNEFVCAHVPESCRQRIAYLGQTAHSQVMSLRRKSYVTVIASRQEVFPYSVLEAMSLGCPIVASTVGGISELIRDQRNGLLVPSNDVKALVEACRKLLESTPFAAQLGRQAWIDCNDLYRPEFIAEQTIAAYQEAIDRFAPRLNGSGSF
jgi:glycosyltransferase involved in cell wall biosynthesis